jgi:hypothetical protein
MFAEGMRRGRPQDRESDWSLALPSVTPIDEIRPAIVSRVGYTVGFAGKAFVRPK